MPAPSLRSRTFVLQLCRWQVGPPDAVAGQSSSRNNVCQPSQPELGLWQLLGVAVCANVRHQ